MDETGDETEERLMEEITHLFKYPYNIYITLLSDFTYLIIFLYLKVSMHILCKTH